MIATRHVLDDARVVHKEAQSLRALGHEVILVLSCNERYEYCRFDGSVVAYGKPPDGKTQYLGCRVVGRPKRRGLWGKWRTFRELGELAASLQADVYHAHEPDLALAIALLARKLLAARGKRAFVIHDMHEYPPGKATDHLPGLLKGPGHAALTLWDKFLSRRVDHIFTANAIVRGYAIHITGGTPTDVLYNGPPLRLFPQRRPAVWPGLAEPLILCHEGSLSFDRGLREMIAAIALLRDHVRLHIVGDIFGAERAWFDREIASKGLEHIITWTGWLPYPDVGKAIEGCHVGLILFREYLNNVMAGPPNKLFNYMNAGLPVVAVGFPEIRRIILEEGCGVLVENQRVEAIVSAIERLLRSPKALPAMGEAGQRAIRDRYSWERMEQTMAVVMDQLADRVEEPD